MFQRLMQEVLSGVTDCEAYLDDIVIYSSIWTDHVEMMNCVFDWLVAANLTLNLAKCDFCKGRCYLFGQKGWPGPGCVGENNCCRVPHSHNKKRAA